MKRFQFRLERLQRLREQALERRRIAHADALRAQHDVESNLHTLARVREQEHELLRRSLAQQAIEIDQIIHGRTYDGYLVKQGVQLVGHLQQLKRLVETRRTDVVEARKDVRILEKLKEKLEDRYLADVALDEKAQMDEIGSRATLRRSAFESIG